MTSHSQSCQLTLFLHRTLASCTLVLGERAARLCPQYSPLNRLPCLRGTQALAATSHAHYLCRHGQQLQAAVCIALPCTRSALAQARAAPQPYCHAVRLAASTCSTWAAAARYLSGISPIPKTPQTVCLSYTLEGVHVRALAHLSRTRWLAARAGCLAALAGSTFAPRHSCLCDSNQNRTCAPGAAGETYAQPADEATFTHILNTGVP